MDPATETGETSQRNSNVWSELQQSWRSRQRWPTLMAFHQGASGRQWPPSGNQCAIYSSGASCHFVATKSLPPKLFLGMVD